MTNNLTRFSVGCTDREIEWLRLIEEQERRDFEGELSRSETVRRLIRVRGKAIERARERTDA